MASFTDAWFLEDALLQQQLEVSEYGDSLFRRIGHSIRAPPRPSSIPSRLALKKNLYDSRRLEPLDESIQIDVTSFEGYGLYRKIFETYESIGLYPMPMQLKVRDAVIKRILGHIYKKDWANYRDVIEQFHQAVGLEMAYFAVAPRRMGKTMCTAATMASIVCVLSRFRILVTSIGMRASQALRESFVLCLRAILGEDYKSYVLVDNQERMEISLSKGTLSDNSIITFLPSSSTGGRGQDADLLVVDEFAFANPSFIQQTIVPIASADKTALIGITTPPTHAGFMLTLLSSKDDSGKPIFPVEHFSPVCAACAKQGLVECPCVQDVTAPWRVDPTKKDLTARLYGKNKKAMSRELGAQMVQDQPPVFDPDKVMALMRKPRLPLGSSVKQIVFFLDPSGGGTGSQTAVVWGYFQDGYLVIAGGGSEDMSDGSKEHETKFVLDQIELCRAKTFGRHIVFCVEMDYSPLAADEWGGVIHRFMHDRYTTPNFTILGELVKNGNSQWVSTAGQRRGPNGPNRHARHFTSFLAHDKVRFASEMGVLNPPRGTSISAHGEALVHAIIQQLSDYRLVPTTSAAARLVGPTKYAMSGKAAGPDDLAVGVQWVAYTLSIVHASPSFCRPRGLTPEVICGSSDTADVEAQGASDEARLQIRSEVDEEAQRKKDKMRCMWFPTDATARAMRQGRGAGSI